MEVFKTSEIIDDTVSYIKPPTEKGRNQKLRSHTGQVPKLKV